MKFLLHGNSPTVATGYGIQIGHLAQALKADGHEVAVSATYGVQGSIIDWKGIRIYGCGYDVQSNDRLHLHADHWFAGETGWIITCMDVWGLNNRLLKDYNVASWTPVDHFPLQDNVKQYFGMTGALPIAMSKFGEKMLFDVGLDPSFIPLTVDTNVYRPVLDIENLTPLQMLAAGGGQQLPDDAFVVGMVAMNKGWAKDRKGFNEAFWGFKAFEETHPDAYLYVHADKWGGAEGQNLYDLAILCGIPPHKLLWSGGQDQYGYYIGYPPPMMATMYTGFDVLLAPSHGEGFCVPLIEAQACGTPVIATDATAQAELIGAGWALRGQFEHDPAHHANYIVPFIANPIDPRDILYMHGLLTAAIEDTEGLPEAVTEVQKMLERLYRVQGLGVLDALEVAYERKKDTEAWEELKQQAVQFAARYDTQKVYDEFWKPFIAQIMAEPEPLQLDREPMPDERAVAVLCPLYKRTTNIAGLVDSFLANTPPNEAALYLIVDEGDREMHKAISDRIPGVHMMWSPDGGMAVTRLTSTAPSFAEKLNVGFTNTTEPWVLCIGDDVRFREGWLTAARKLSGEFDVIGTNDAIPPRVKNPKVARGTHADHFFVRRAYVDEYGASLDGPGVLAPEAYRHWYVDEEICRLARARAVFSPCLESIVEHMHPGYDGLETARLADPTYMIAVQHSEDDAATFKSRLPLIEMQRQGIGAR